MSEQGGNWNKSDKKQGMHMGNTLLLQRDVRTLIDSGFQKKRTCPTAVQQADPESIRFFREAGVRQHGQEEGISMRASSSAYCTLFPYMR